MKCVIEAKREGWRSMNDIRKSLESRNKPPRTARELADYFGVPYKTAWSWYAGKTLPKDESMRSRLMDLVQAGPPASGDTLPFEQTKGGEGAGQTREPASPRHDLVAHLAEVRSLAAELNAKLVLLTEEVKTSDAREQQTSGLLELFVSQLYDMSATLAVVVSDNDRRNAFRQRVSKEDVAYLTTLLGSLLDEQKFTLWKAFQAFPMKGAKHK
jgi:hypothetical protein